MIPFRLKPKEQSPRRFLFNPLIGKYSSSSSIKSASITSTSITQSHQFSAEFNDMQMILAGMRPFPSNESVPSMLSLPAAFFNRILIRCCLLQSSLRLRQVRGQQGAHILLLGAASCSSGTRATC